jgi:hypothetical protein
MDTDPLVYVVTQDSLPSSSIESNGDGHSRVFLDFTLRVICIADAQSLDTSASESYQSLM